MLPWTVIVWRLIRLRGLKGELFNEVSRCQGVSTFSHILTMFPGRGALIGGRDKGKSDLQSLPFWQFCPLAIEEPEMFGFKYVWHLWPLARIWLLSGPRTFQALSQERN